MPYRVAGLHSTTVLGWPHGGYSAQLTLLLDLLLMSFLTHICWGCTLHTSLFLRVFVLCLYIYIYICVYTTAICIFVFEYIPAGDQYSFGVKLRGSLFSKLFACLM